MSRSKQPVRRTSTTKNTRTQSRKKTSSRKKKESWFKRTFKRIFLLGFYVGLMVTALLSIWAWWLDQELVKSFEGQKWQVPAEVYSAPTILKTGDPWRKDDLANSFKQAGYRFGRNSQEIGWAAKSSTKVSAHLRAFSDHTGSYPAERRIFSFEGGRLHIKNLSGRTIDTAILEPQLIGHLYGGNTESRELLTFEQIPQLLIDSLLAVEDRDFYNHWGISITGIARAMWVNFQSGSRRQGGSTLTQQLIKNMYLTSERSYTRKVREMVMALLLEYRFSKEEILTAYVNEVYLAQRGKQAIHGFAAASKYFFARPLNELSVEEMATLVGMVKGPSLYNPKRSPKRAKERRNVVLALLQQQGFISESGYKRAIKKPIRVIELRESRSLYGDYLDLVAFQLSNDFDRGTLATENLKIYTGLDTRVQQAAVEGMKAQVKTLRRQKADLRDVEHEETWSCTSNVKKERKSTNLH